MRYIIITLILLFPFLGFSQDKIPVKQLGISAGSGININGSGVISNTHDDGIYNKRISVRGVFGRPVSYMDSIGIFSNGSGLEIFPATSGIPSNASVLGLLTKTVPSTFYDGVSAAIAGIDQTTNSGGNRSESYAGYFGGDIKVTGAHYVNTTAINLDGSNYTLKDDDYFIRVRYKTNSYYIQLPTTAQIGRMIIIKNDMTATDFSVRCNSAIIIDKSGYHKTSTIIGNGGSAIFIYDGSFWNQIS